MAAKHLEPVKLTYRPENDGLRAIAVVSVLFFHADFAGFAGGFVGVDVFFVISGFLITGILIAENLAGDFSILRFYERRVRRILPALYLVLAVSFAVALYLLLPSRLVDFARSALAALSSCRTATSGATPTTSGRTRRWSPCCTPGASASRRNTSCSSRWWCPSSGGSRSRGWRASSPSPRSRASRYRKCCGGRVLRHSAVSLRPTSSGPPV